MNGVNEVQSSSMVQQRWSNGFTSSPLAEQSSMEQFVTIMEDINGEQGAALTSSSMSLQAIPNRVLTEISVTLTNTPTPSTVNKQTNDNPSRDSNVNKQANDNPSRDSNVEVGKLNHFVC